MKLRIVEEHFEIDPRVNDIYNSASQNLRQMFYSIPRIEKSADGIYFALDKYDGKSVTAATLKRWVKNLPFKTRCWRNSPHAHISDRYEYYIKIDE